MFFLNSFRGMARWAAAHCPGLPGMSKQQRRLMIKPNLIQRSLFVFLAALTSVFVWLVAFTSADDEHGRRPQTFTVLVGAEDVSQGATVTAFFPETLRIHVGDTVHWQKNADEIHTVTFLVDMELPPFNLPHDGPPSPLMRNPLLAFPTVPDGGLYDGTTFANSGIFGPDPEIFQGVESFDLTFTRPGTFNYVCGVHGARMSGQIIVVGRHEEIRSPREIAQQARRLIAGALREIPAALALANAEVPPPTLNPDGITYTFHPLVGFTVGQLDLLRFFPDELAGVHPGDTVEWTFSMEDLPPHTITFLNGAESPDDLLVVPNPPGPPFLFVNPEVLFPQNPGQPLTGQGIYSSGILRVGDPGDPPPSFSIVIGDISGLVDYQCLLHDSLGMIARLRVE
jgi:plastocyanin